MYAFYLLAVLLVGSAIAYGERSTVKAVLVTLAGVVFLLGTFWTRLT